MLRVQEPKEAVTSEGVGASRLQGSFNASWQMRRVEQPISGVSETATRVLVLRQSKCNKRQVSAALKAWIIGP